MPIIDLVCARLEEYAIGYSLDLLPHAPSPYGGTRRMTTSAAILVIDDEAQIRRTLRTTLAGAGYRVLDARNGEEALLKIREETPDLLIIDVNMPGMSGFEVCREIREASDAPIIMLSVRSGERDKGTRTRRRR